MPRFLHPNAEELNSLRRPRQQVVKNLMRTYRGTETTIGQQGDLTDKYNRMYESMVNIQTSMSEVLNQLNLGFGSPGQYGSRAMDRYLGVVSQTTREVARLLLFMEQEVPSLQIFTTEQIQTLSGLNDQVVGTIEQLDKISTSMPATSLGKFRSVISPLVQDIGTLQSKLEGLNTPGGRGSLTQFGKDPSTFMRRGAAAQLPQPAPGGADSGDGDDDDSDPTFVRRSPSRGKKKKASDNFTPFRGNRAGAGDDTEGSGRPDFANAHRVDLRLPMAVGGAYTHARFL